MSRNVDAVARAARLYRANADAARALGIAAGTFTRWCRELGIETPNDRYRKIRKMEGNRSCHPVPVGG